jgi:hypothetical protein
MAVTKPLASPLFQTLIVIELASVASGATWIFGRVQREAFLWF